jgi:ankyrin repeat protein
MAHPSTLKPSRLRDRLQPPSEYPDTELSRIIVERIGDPIAQAETIGYLISVGADPNCMDRSGVSPLHRAVRTRSLAAVRALVDGGADQRQPNRNGSTPLHLAVQTTGRGGSGSPRAREQQAGIVKFLLERGARASDQDRRGRSVHQAATSEWTRALLMKASPG